jgi:hypothetical protein
MALTITWDATFEAVPADNAFIANGPEDIRNFKVATRERVAVEHSFDGDADDGAHKKGSARAYYQSSDPTKRPDGTTNLGSEDAGRLFFASGTKRLRVFNGTSFIGAGGGVISTTHNSSTDQNDLFDGLSTAVPNIGDDAMLTGMYGSTSGAISYFFHGQYVTRTGTSAIRLYGFRSNFDYTSNDYFVDYGYYTCTNGSSSAPAWTVIVGFIDSAGAAAFTATPIG